MLYHSTLLESWGFKQLERIPEVVTMVSSPSGVHVLTELSQLLQFQSVPLYGIAQANVSSFSISHHLQ